jgi:hypothetical protein
MSERIEPVTKYNSAPGAEGFDGVDGVDASSFYLDIGNLEVVVPANGETDHLQPLHGRGHVFLLFMRREKGGDEQYPVQLQPVTHLFGSCQVAVMDGIERPTDDSESLWQNTLPFRISDC